MSIIVVIDKGVVPFLSTPAHWRGAQERQMYTQTHTHTHTHSFVSNEDDDDDDTGDGDGGNDGTVSVNSRTLERGTRAADFTPTLGYS
jgi:hypothetical protein